MGKKSIVISVQGETNTGKSTLVYLIKKVLKEHGIEVVFNGGGDFRDEKTFDEIIGKNIDLKANAIKDKTKVIIAEEQIVLNYKKTEEE